MDNTAIEGNHEPEEGSRFAYPPWLVPAGLVIGVEDTDRDGVEGGDQDGDLDIEGGAEQPRGDREGRSRDGRAGWWRCQWLRLSVWRECEE